MRRRGILAAVSASVVVAAFLTAAPASAAGAAAHRSASRALAPAARAAVHRIGTVNFRKLAAKKLKAPHYTKAQIRRFRHDSMLVNRTVGSHRAAPRLTPSLRSRLAGHVAPRQLVNQTLTSWAGTNALQQAGVNGFDLEPPDQGLCAGTTGNGTYVMEAVNLALTITDGSGGAPPGGIASYGTVPLFQFFNQSPTTWFLSDPKCTYNPATQRWVVSLLEFNAITGAGGATLFAVSQTNDPTGTWTVYSISSQYGGCSPYCLGDQPLLGTDANGIYLSMNEFNLFTSAFYGPLVWAVSWPTPGAPSTTGHPFGMATPFPAASNGTVAYSLQPAVDPLGIGSSGDATNKGVEWFLATNDNGLVPGSATIDVWAISNTDALTPSGSGSPALHGPTAVSVSSYSDVYSSVNQASGPTPLGSFLATQPGSATYTGGSPILNNDDRMNQVAFSTNPYTGAPQIWGGYNVSACTYFLCFAVDTGFNWAGVEPTLSGSTLTASLYLQGSVGPDYGTDYWFPSIGVSPTTGTVVAAFDTASWANGTYPSVGYAQIADTYGNVNSSPTTYNVWQGQAPEDGFTCYSNFSYPYTNSPCRWGDYSALSVTPDGTMWFAGETALAAGQRDFYANWGTAVAELPTSMQTFTVHRG